MQFVWSFVHSLLSSCVYTHIHMHIYIHTHMRLIMCMYTHNSLFFLKHLRINFTHHDPLNRLVLFTVEGILLHNHRAVLNFDNKTLILLSDLYVNIPTVPLMFRMKTREGQVLQVVVLCLWSLKGFQGLSLSLVTFLKLESPTFLKTGVSSLWFCLMFRHD